MKYVLLIPELPFTHRGLAFGPKGYKFVSVHKDAVECSSSTLSAASVTSCINSVVVYAFILYCVTQHFMSEERTPLVSATNLS